MLRLIRPTVRGTTKQDHADQGGGERVIRLSREHPCSQGYDALTKTCTRSINTDAAAYPRQHQRPELSAPPPARFNIFGLHILRNFTRNVVNFLIGIDAAGPAVQAVTPLLPLCWLELR